MKAIIVILFSIVKFGMTFPMAILIFHFGFFKTIILTNIGGIAGIFIFGFLSKQIIQLWNSKFSAIFQRLSVRSRRKSDRPRKPVFTRRNRHIVYIKKRYGLPGIALATPILLSIPVGVFLAFRYFSKNNHKFLYLFLGNFIWSLAYATFYGFCYDMYLQVINSL